VIPVPNQRSTSAWQPRGMVVHLTLAAIGGAVLAGLASLTAAQSVTAPARLEAQVEQRIALNEVLLETIRIESQLQSWTLRKVCVSGQAYWVGFGDTTPTGIAPAYKDGRPEPCMHRPK
jgi:hypothetical protein